MEKQLFDWFEWDDIDVGIFQYFDCVVKNVSPYPVGTKIPIIIMNYQNGTMTLIDENNQEMDKFKLQFFISVDD